MQGLHARLAIEGGGGAGRPGLGSAGGRAVVTAGDGV